MLSVALLLMAVTLVFLPGLRGPFLYDDYPNFLLNSAVRAYARHEASLFLVLREAHAGPLGRPISVASMAFQYAISGAQPLPFKVFNLAIHLCNAVLVYLLASQLLPPAPLRQRRAAALLTALIWSAHPLVLSPVLYVVQRMTSLASLGLLAALNSVVMGHRCLIAHRRAWPWLWLAVPMATAFALLSKESGVLLPAYIAVLAGTVLSDATLTLAARRVWQRFLLVFVGLPLAMATVVVPWVLPRMVASFADRDFTVGQRLLTEARVIWLYVRLLVVPDLRLLGIFHDDFVLSTGWWQPTTTLPAVIGVLGLALAALALRRRYPWFALAVGFFLAGQLLESTVVPLELMHEHRAYLGMVGPVLAAVAALLHATAVRPARVARPLWAAAGTIALLLAALCTWRADDWGNPLGMALVEAEHHPDSTRAQYEVSSLYANLAERASGSERARLFADASAAARRAARAAPRDTKPLVGLLLICSQSDCAIPDQIWPDLQQRLRTGSRADLMISDVRSLAECRHDGSCRLPLPPILASFEALEQNPRLTMRGHAELDAERDALLREANPGWGS